MRRKAIPVVLSIVTALAFSFGPANAAPDPIPFCMPDFDGHCRNCEIRFAPVSIRCVGA